MLKATETPKRRTALGQGLQALIPVEETADQRVSDRSVKWIPIDSLLPNPYQPRRTFAEDALRDLAASIKEMGVIQPLIVRKTPAGKYEIVAGERRWRAAGMAEFTTIPVIVRQLSDSESLEIALIENLQRENLNPLDTAEAYDTLIAKFSYTHDSLAKRIGKDRTSVTNHLRLLKLPEPVKQHLRNELISMGHARTLLAVESVPTLLKLSEKTINRKLSVRELERIVQNYKDKHQVKAAPVPVRDEETAALETRLSRYLSTRVTIKTKNNNAGKIEIHFHSKEELARLLDAVGYSEDFS
ncbi:MAG: ParB/RepB/Spo0J family partition protein [Desulfomonile tiedjei]|nr:ParB/RepB/Spo0J family partition protein [Desulfomonile tiedjei]